MIYIQVNVPCRKTNTILFLASLLMLLFRMKFKLSHGSLFNFEPFEEPTHFSITTEHFRMWINMQTQSIPCNKTEECGNETHLQSQKCAEQYSKHNLLPKGQPFEMLSTSNFSWFEKINWMLISVSKNDTGKIWQWKTNANS